MKLIVSIFVQNVNEPKKNLISENSIKFVRIVENKGSNVLKEKAIVFPKVQTVSNQVFVITGLNKNDTPELMSLVNNDSANGCDEFFLSKPIDNGDETKGLSEMTSWKTKGKYISEPLNRVNPCYDQAGPSGTKDVSSETFSEENKMSVRKKNQNLTFISLLKNLLQRKDS